MRFLLALLTTNLAASLSLRASFWLAAAFMAVNNLLFFTFWWILFARFDDIRGYELGDVSALFGISAAGYGLAAIVFGGLPELGRKIEDGELDAMLTQPKSVLVQAIGSRTSPAGWGDLASGLGLLALSGHLDLASAPLAVLGLALASATFVASGVTLHSLVFFLGHGGSLARQLGEFLITFTLYPPTLFDGALRVVLFTILPAGFISYLPVELLRAPDPWIVLAAIAGTAAHVAVALWLFDRGLRRYTSGNRFR